MIEDYEGKLRKDFEKWLFEREVYREVLELIYFDNDLNSYEPLERGDPIHVFYSVLVTIAWDAWLEQEKRMLNYAVRSIRHAF